MDIITLENRFTKDCARNDARCLQVLGAAVLPGEKLEVGKLGSWEVESSYEAYVCSQEDFGERGWLHCLELH